MTISTTGRKVTYTCDGEDTEFTVPFYFKSNADIVAVYINSLGARVTLGYGTDYTLAGAGDATGGTLTCTEAPADGGSIEIKRTLDFTQETLFRSQGTFSPALHESALDKITMLLHQLQDADEDVTSALEAEIAALREEIAANPGGALPSEAAVTAEGTTNPVSLAEREARQVWVTDFGDFTRVGAGGAGQSSADRDTNAETLQAALNWVTELDESTDEYQVRAKVLNVPSGTYQINGQIIMPVREGKANLKTTLTGQGMHASILQFYDLDEDEDCFLVQNDPGQTYARDFVIRDMTFEAKCNCDAVVYLDHPWVATIENVRASGYGDTRNANVCIHIETGYDCTYRDLRAEYFRTAGILIGENALSGVTTLQKFFGGHCSGRGVGINIRKGTSCMFIGFDIEACLTGGAWISQDEESACDCNASFMGCHFESNLGYAIACGGTTDATYVTQKDPTQTYAYRLATAGFVSMFNLYLHNVARQWYSGYTYGTGLTTGYAYYGGNLYRSLQSSNLNHIPGAGGSELWWAIDQQAVGYTHWDGTGMDAQVCFQLGWVRYGMSFADYITCGPTLPNAVSIYGPQTGYAEGVPYLRRNAKFRGNLDGGRGDNNEVKVKQVVWYPDFAIYDDGSSQFINGDDTLEVVDYGGAQGVIQQPSRTGRNPIQGPVTYDGWSRFNIWPTPTHGLLENGSYWLSTVTYGAGAKVHDGLWVYTSDAAGNLNHQPDPDTVLIPTPSPHYPSDGYWTKVTVQPIALRIGSQYSGIQNATLIRSSTVQPEAPYQGLATGTRLTFHFKQNEVGGHKLQFFPIVNFQHTWSNYHVGTAELAWPYDVSSITFISDGYRWRQESYEQWHGGRKTWSAGTTYYYLDRVTYDSKFYICKYSESSHSGQQPDIATTYWTEEDEG